jgi:hypothetical protein
MCEPGAVPGQAYIERVRVAFSKDRSFEEFPDGKMMIEVILSDSVQENRHEGGREFTVTWFERFCDVQPTTDDRGRKLLRVEISDRMIKEVRENEVTELNTNEEKEAMHVWLLDLEGGRHDLVVSSHRQIVYDLARGGHRDMPSSTDDWIRTPFYMATPTTTTEDVLRMIEAILYNRERLLWSMLK